MAAIRQKKVNAHFLTFGLNSLKQFFHILKFVHALFDMRFVYKLMVHVPCPESECAMWKTWVQYKTRQMFGGDKVSMLTYTYPHKPRKKSKVTICNHQALTAHFMRGLMSDMVICKFRKSIVIPNVLTGCH